MLQASLLTIPLRILTPGLLDQALTGLIARPASPRARRRASCQEGRSLDGGGDASLVQDVIQSGEPRG